MAKKYTRKQLDSMDQLDLEQERIRNKSRKIEYDFVEALQPQQLAITFLGNFLRRKLTGNKKQKRYIVDAPKNKVVSANTHQGKIDRVRKHPLFKSMLKKVGISFLKWQAFNLALFAGKKIYHAIKDKKKPEPVAAPVSFKKKVSGILNRQHHN